MSWHSGSSFCHLFYSELPGPALFSPYAARCRRESQRLRFDGVSEHLLGFCSENIRQHVFRAEGWKIERRLGTLAHGGVLLGLKVFSKPNQTQVCRLVQGPSFTEFCYRSLKDRECLINTRQKLFNRCPVSPTFFRIEPFGQHVEGLSPFWD